VVTLQRAEARLDLDLVHEREEAIESRPLKNSYMSKARSSFSPALPH